MESTHRIEDLTNIDGGDGMGDHSYFLLDDGTVLQVFKFGGPGAYSQFVSKEEVLKHNSYFRNVVATMRKGPIPMEESYAVSASEILILEKEHQKQLSDLLNIPFEQLDHSIASLDKIDMKIKKLSIDKIDQLAMLLNIYGCKVIAKETGGETIIVPAYEGHFTMKAKDANMLYFPMALILKQLDEFDEGFSFGFVVDWLLNGKNYKINGDQNKPIDSNQLPLIYYLQPPEIQNNN